MKQRKLLCRKEEEEGWKQIGNIEQKSSQINTANVKSENPNEKSHTKEGKKP